MIAAFMTGAFATTDSKSALPRSTSVLIILLVCSCLRAYDRVETIDGAVYIGRILDESEASIVMETPDGVVVIPDERIEKVERAVDTSDEAEEEEDRKWVRRGELGAMLWDGKETEASARVAITANRRTDEARVRLGASYFYLESTGDNDENRARAEGLQEWLYPDSEWSRFLSGTYDYDDYREWKHRLSASYGVGYDFRSTRELTLTGRAGAGLLKEFSGERSLDMEGDLAVELEWQRSDTHRLFLQNLFLPNLSDFGKYRNQSKVTWSIRLSQRTDMFLAFTLENEYESRTTEDDPHNDLRLSTSLMLEF